jgi:uncharacterized protein (DUF1697 family)
MPETFVGLLYSIGISGGRRLIMAEWREMMIGMGLVNPRTLIATGNVVFEHEPVAVGELEARLEKAYEMAFGRHVDCIVTPAKSFQKLARENPFKPESKQDGARVMVRVMRAPLEKEIEATLARYLIQGERVKIVGGHLWMHFPGPFNTSKLAPVLGSKRLGIGTVRNWNTIRRLGEMIAPVSTQSKTKLVDSACRLAAAKKNGPPQAMGTE